MTEDKEEEEKSTKPPAGSSKSGWKNWKKAKESDSGGEESKITYCHWLLKSEPESRLEKGVDVKVSTDTHSSILIQQHCGLILKEEIGVRLLSCR